MVLMEHSYVVSFFATIWYLFLFLVVNLVTLCFDYYIKLVDLNVHSRAGCLYVDSRSCG